MAAALTLALLFLAGMRGLAAPFPSLELNVAPRTVHGEGLITLTITVTNPTADALPLDLRLSLPPEVEYVPGSARVRIGNSPVDVAPTFSDGELRWSDLTLPPGRQANMRGINTFVQDHCEDAGLVNWQLDKARELVGEGGVVKQLVMSIDVDTWTIPSCWVDFVWGAYHRGLDPVLRLQGKRSGDVWLPPDPRGAYPYAEIAARYRAFVAGLPRVDGRTLYVQVWNEPNRREEWGGRVDPAAYARFFSAVADAIHSLGDPRIRVLNAPLAPTGDYDNLAFMDAMFTAVPEALHKFDIWASHAYPGNHPPEYNHHDGTAAAGDRHTIDAYVLELARLAQWGRPGARVLISETGYALGDASFPQFRPIDEETRADYMVRAFRDHWNRWPEIVAVAPFQLSDPDGRWRAWDWIAPSGVPHLQYTRVAQLDLSPFSGRLVVTLQARANQVTAPTVAYVTARAEFPTTNIPPLNHTVSLLLLPPENLPAPCTTCTPSPAPPPPTPTPRLPEPTPTPAPEATVRTWRIGGAPHGMAVHPATRALAVTDYTAGTVRVVVPPRGDVVNTFAWPGYWGMDKVAWSSSPPGIVATLQYAGALIFSPENADLVRFLPVGEWPIDLAVAPEVGRAFVISARDRTLTVVDLFAWKVETTLEVEGTPTALDYDPAWEEILVAARSPHRIMRVDARTLHVVGTLSLDEPPDDVAVDAARGLLAVSHRTARRLSLISLDGTTRKTFALDCAPHKVALNAKLAHVYVLCTNGGVQVWHEGTGRPIAVFPTDGDTDIAVDTWAHRVYVSAAPKGTITFIQDTPYLKATFGIYHRLFLPAVHQR